METSAGSDREIPVRNGAYGFAEYFPAPFPAYRRKYMPNNNTRKNCRAADVSGPWFGRGAALAKRRTITAVPLGAPAKALCVPKIRFCNIGDEGRQGQAVR